MSSREGTVVGIQWQQLMARRAAAIRSSIAGNFGELPTHPDLIDFAGGAPAAECLPIDRMRYAHERAWNVDEPRVLHYGESEGYLTLRQMIAERMARRGARVSPGEIVVTAGSQQGLELIAKAMLEPGDRVVVEAPTYFGALQIFDIYEAEYAAVPVDEQGIIPERLEEALQAFPRPKLIYLIPTFQNPSGVALSPERRSAVIELSHRYNVPIVEDDPYGELWFRNGDHPPLRALDPDVLYLGTFSKTLAPSLRMGWMVVPPELVKMFVDAKESVDIQSDRIVQRAIVIAAADGWLDEHVAAVRAHYGARCDHMLECLVREMPPGVHWTEPEGGFFVWVTLPEGGPTADQLLPEAIRHGARYNTGSLFYPDWEPRSSFRLGFSALPRERITEGIARLGLMLREHYG
jgi:2-aminoadipate transaminase